MKQFSTIILILSFCWIAQWAGAQTFGTFGADARFGVSAPSAQMQSTSGYFLGSHNTGFGAMHQGNNGYGEDGISATPYAVTSGPKHARDNGGSPTPTVDPNDRLPIGDAVLPMLLLLAGYAILRRKREQEAR